MLRTLSHPCHRRDWLRSLIGIGLAWFAPRWAVAAETPPGRVALSPELTEGPYYIDLERIRRDITEGKRGVPLRLRVRVVDDATGKLVPNAAVDVWHCDAQGVYSGFSSHSPGHGGPPLGVPMGGGQPFFMTQDGPFPPPPPGVTGAPHPPPGGHGFTHKPDNKQTFLRGVQLTGPEGVTEIDTIYPGWYMGRTTHVHVRVHIGGRVADGRYRGGRIAHTGQIFFPEAVTDRVYQLAAYRKKEVGRTSLSQDGIFLQGGSEVTAVTLVDPDRLEDGVVCESRLIVNPQADQGRHSEPF